MAGANIKIGLSTYQNVEVINVDKDGGGTANYLYEGLPARGKTAKSTVKISLVKTNISRTSKTINTNISLVGG